MALTPETIRVRTPLPRQESRGRSSRPAPDTARVERIGVAALLLLAVAMPGRLGEVTLASLVDAYIQVSVFVFATLFAFFLAEEIFEFDIGKFFRRSRLLQIPVASFLGALPGCGGAIIVVASYTSGNVSMGAVVATLTATMGDAAFLLIATRPDAAVIVLPLAMVAGVVTGYVVDVFDRNHFRHSGDPSAHLPRRIWRVRLRDWAFAVPALPGLGLGIAALFQVEFTGWLELAATVAALAGMAIGFAIWAVSPVRNLTHPDDPALTRAAEETSFITVWVVAAFLAYEYLDQFAGLDLAAAFKAAGPVLPLIAIGVGFIPGCGPQVLVTTLYINGLIPFAALLGNAIANDGDALFPALALTPRAALIATLYSAIPALILAYTFFYFLPGIP